MKKNKYGWFKSNKGWHWWTDPPYNEIDIIKGRNGYTVFLNNRGWNMIPFSSLTRAKESAYRLMRRRSRKT
jgi:hypothetical protein